MVKASLKLANGTVVTIDGTPKEVKHLLEFYSDKSPSPSSSAKPGLPPTKVKSGISKATIKTADAEKPDLPRLLKLIKDCDEAEAIETNILDRASRIDRTLLPLYIVHEHLNNAFGLTSDEISKITTDLGVPTSQSNASKALSGSASKYVIADKVKKKGRKVRYKLSRRGVKYLKGVLRGSGGAK